MRLRKECEHGRWEPHSHSHWSGPLTGAGYSCPGGVFLPDDTLVIERFEYIIRLWGTDLNDAGVTGLATELFDALTDREGDR